MPIYYQVKKQYLCPSPRQIQGGFGFTTTTTTTTTTTSSTVLLWCALLLLQLLLLCDNPTLAWQPQPQPNNLRRHYGRWPPSVVVVVVSPDVTILSHTTTTTDSLDSLARSITNRMEQEDDDQQSRAPRHQNPNSSFFSLLLMLQRSLLSTLLVCLVALFFMSCMPSPSNAISDATRLASGKQYWTIMNEGDREEKIEANQALMDYAVGTINTMYYDNTGGASFQPREFFAQWRNWLNNNNNINNNHKKNNNGKDVTAAVTATSGREQLATRQGVVDGLSWLTQQLHDPFSKYLTREELLQELTVNTNSNRNDGFLIGSLGAVVEPASERVFFGTLRTPVLSDIPPSLFLSSSTSSSSASSPVHHHHHTPAVSSLSKTYSASLSTSSSSSSSSSLSKQLLAAKAVSSLPVLTAVVPNSPAERAGFTVGDRIVSVQGDSFLNLTPEQTQRLLEESKTKIAAKDDDEQETGLVELIVAKPVYAATSTWTTATTTTTTTTRTSQPPPQEYGNNARSVIVAYRPQRIRLATTSTLPSSSSSSSTSATAFEQSLTKSDSIHNGILQYQMLTADSSSPFRSVMGSDPTNNSNNKVGYIRLTRFSKASTEAFVQAAETLESQGANEYILDLRNNYGGVIQEAMLTASSLLRDPHTVLCYTLNSRGGFTPHAVEEYVVDHGYPGYLLSRQSKFVTLQQVKKESPQFFKGDGWSPPSSFASLREQNVKRGIRTRPPSSTSLYNMYASSSPTTNFVSSSSNNNDISQVKARMQFNYRRVAQKPLVLLVNEGTASAAEVFASSLHDNGRTVAVVGTRTYGKGYVSFPP